jgi:hypothetical protein
MGQAVASFKREQYKQDCDFTGYLNVVYPISKSYIPLKIKESPHGLDLAQSETENHKKVKEIYQLSAEYEIISSPNLELGSFRFADNGPNRILLLGEQGIGKSSLLQFISFKWAHKKLWNSRFDCLWRIDLKEFGVWLTYAGDYGFCQIEQNVKKIRTHTDLYDKFSNFLFYLERKRLGHVDPVVAKKEFQTQLVNGGRILLLLDGYDELLQFRAAELDCLGVNIQDELKGFISAFPNIIFASRYCEPYENGLVASNLFQTITKVLGFTLDSRVEYIKRYFKCETKSEYENLDIRDVISILDGNSHVQEICRVPAYLEVLCYLKKHGYARKKLKGDFNVTMFYQQIEQMNEAQYQKKYGTAFSLEQYQFLCQLSFQSLNEGHIGGVAEKTLLNLLDQHNIKKKDEELSFLRSLDKVGFVHTVDPSWRIVQNRYFAHKSFQEYFTASYIVRRLKENDYSMHDFIAVNRYEESFLQVMKFVPGILSLSSSLDRDGNDIMVPFFSLILRPEKDNIVNDILQPEENSASGHRQLSVIMHLLSQFIYSDVEFVLKQNPDLEKMCSTNIKNRLAKDPGIWVHAFCETGYSILGFLDCLVAKLCDETIKPIEFSRVTQLLSTVSARNKMSFKYAVEGGVTDFLSLIVKRYQVLTKSNLLNLYDIECVLRCLTKLHHSKPEIEKLLNDQLKSKNIFCNSIALELSYFYMIYDNPCAQIKLQKCSESPIYALTSLKLLTKYSKELKCDDPVVLDILLSCISFRFRFPVSSTATTDVWLGDERTKEACTFVFNSLSREENDIPYTNIDCIKLFKQYLSKKDFAELNFKKDCFKKFKLILFTLLTYLTFQEDFLQHPSFHEGVKKFIADGVVSLARYGFRTDIRHRHVCRWNYCLLGVILLLKVGDLTKATKLVIRLFSLELTVVHMEEKEFRSKLDVISSKRSIFFLIMEELTGTSLANEIDVPDTGSDLYEPVDATMQTYYERIVEKYFTSVIIDIISASRKAVRKFPYPVMIFKARNSKRNSNNSVLNVEKLRCSLLDQLFLYLEEALHLCVWSKPLIISFSKKLQPIFHLENNSYIISKGFQLLLVLLKESLELKQSVFELMTNLDDFPYYVRNIANNAEIARTVYEILLHFVRGYAGILFVNDNCFLDRLLLLFRYLPVSLILGFLHDIRLTKSSLSLSSEFINSYNSVKQRFEYSKTIILDKHDRYLFFYPENRTIFLLQKLCLLYLLLIYEESVNLQKGTSEDERTDFLISEMIFPFNEDTENVLLGFLKSFREHFKTTSHPDPHYNSNLLKSNDSWSKLFLQLESRAYISNPMHNDASVDVSSVGAHNNVILSDDIIVLLTNPFFHFSLSIESLRKLGFSCFIYVEEEIPEDQEGGSFVGKSIQFLLKGKSENRFSLKLLIELVLYHPNALFTFSSLSLYDEIIENDLLLKKVSYLQEDSIIALSHFLINTLLSRTGPKLSLNNFRNAVGAFSFFLFEVQSNPSFRVEFEQQHYFIYCLFLFRCYADHFDALASSHPDQSLRSYVLGFIKPFSDLFNYGFLTRLMCEDVYQQDFSKLVIELMIFDHDRSNQSDIYFRENKRSSSMFSPLRRASPATGSPVNSPNRPALFKDASTPFSVYGTFDWEETYFLSKIVLYLSSFTKQYSNSSVADNDNNPMISLFKKWLIDSVCCKHPNYEFYYLVLDIIAWIVQMNPKIYFPLLLPLLVVYCQEAKINILFDNFQMLFSKLFTLTSEKEEFRRCYEIILLQFLADTEESLDISKFVIFSQLVDYSKSLFKLSNHSIHFITQRIHALLLGLKPRELTTVSCFYDIPFHEMILQFMIELLKIDDSISSSMLVKYDDPIQRFKLIIDDETDLKENSVSSGEHECRDSDSIIDTQRTIEIRESVSHLNDVNILLLINIINSKYFYSLSEAHLSYFCKTCKLQLRCQDILENYELIAWIENEEIRKKNHTIFMSIDWDYVIQGLFQLLISQNELLVERGLLILFKLPMFREKTLRESFVGSVVDLHCLRNFQKHIFTIFKKLKVKQQQGEELENLDTGEGLRNMYYDLFLKLVESQKLTLEKVLNVNPISIIPFLPSTKKYHFFLSHDWGADKINHRRVMQIKDALHLEGIVSWFDERQIGDHTVLFRKAMLSGIQASMGMIVFLTDNYHQKIVTQDESY